MITNILLPLDGSALAERPLPYAARLAKATRARLRLLYVTSGVPASPARAREELDNAARIEYLAQDLRRQGVQATTRTMPADTPATAILDAAGDSPADLIVMSTHGRSGIGRWLYGSVADEVLRQAAVPVLLISAACHQPWPEDRPLKVLVPLDGSDLSEAALGPARALSEAVGATLLYLGVVVESTDAVALLDPIGVTIRQASPRPYEEAQAYLAQMSATPGPGQPSPDVLVDIGDPSSSIAKIARQEGVDLIVMATHGRTGLARLTMGSVATTTVQRAHVPILLVRPQELSLRAVEQADEGAAAPELVQAWPPIGTR